MVDDARRTGAEAFHAPLQSAPTPSAQASMIKSNVSVWVNRADLTRTGMDPMAAKVLQSCGVMGVAGALIVAASGRQLIVREKADGASSP